MFAVCACLHRLVSFYKCWIDCRQKQHISYPLDAPTAQDSALTASGLQSKFGFNCCCQFCFKFANTLWCRFFLLLDIALVAIFSIASFKASNSLESDLASILKQYGYSERDMSKKEADQLASRQVSQQEVKERQAELARARSLMFFHEMKSKRVKKIKSKAYRRIKKKQRVKISMSGCLHLPLTWVTTFRTRKRWKLKSWKWWTPNLQMTRPESKSSKGSRREWSYPTKHHPSGLNANYGDTCFYWEALFVSLFMLFSVSSLMKNSAKGSKSGTLPAWIWNTVCLTTFFCEGIQGSLATRSRDALQVTQIV